MFQRTKSLPAGRRSKNARSQVTLTLDGRSIGAEVGEPIAVALLAAGEGAIARSPKLHRPRGPACLRGDCDGCLARVDGVPNVMTCLVPCRGGEAVEVQNVLGTRKTDLLRITDWFFPKGIDHHHLMAGIPAVGDVMQTFARQMAGIGRLPADVVGPAPASTRRVEVLVVGGGL
ncbi:MAG TPA: (2Fe-2S)-binding protein, partial [Polyangiaceae bacterium]|nr:(2Fe-2S)-binding protein [Polyangiaceae bacterium]